MAGRWIRPRRLDLVELAVAEERPDVLRRGVLDAAVVQVAVHPGLRDGVHRAQAHRHRRVFPERRHQAGVRVGRQTAGRMRDLLPEAVHGVGGQPALEEGPGVHAGRGVALEEDVVTAAGVRLAAEEVVVADLVQGGRGGVGGDVAADADAGPLGAVDHHRCIPPDPVAVAPLDLLVAGEERLRLGGDGVDVVGGGQCREADVPLAGPAQQAQHEVAGPLLTVGVDHGVERVEPLLGFLRIGVGELRGESVADQVQPGRARFGPGGARRGAGGCQGISSSKRGRPRGAMGTRFTVGGVDRRLRGGGRRCPPSFRIPGPGAAAGVPGASGGGLSEGPHAAKLTSRRVRIRAEVVIETRRLRGMVLGGRFDRGRRRLGGRSACGLLWSVRQDPLQA